MATGISGPARGGALSELLRLWHVTVTVAGDDGRAADRPQRAAAAQRPAAVPALAEVRRRAAPRSSTGRRPRACSTPPRSPCGCGTSTGESAGLPRWEVVGLEVLRAHRSSWPAAWTYHVIVDLHDVTPLPVLRPRCRLRWRHDRRRPRPFETVAAARPCGRPRAGRWPPAPPRTPRCTRWPTRWSAATADGARRQRRATSRAAARGRHRRGASSTGCGSTRTGSPAMADGPARRRRRCPTRSARWSAARRSPTGSSCARCGCRSAWSGSSTRPGPTSPPTPPASASSPATPCCCAAPRARRRSNAAIVAVLRDAVAGGRAARRRRCSWCRARATSRSRR